MATPFASRTLTTLLGDPDAVAERVSADQVKVLGDLGKRGRYARLMDGRELRLDARVQPFEEANPLRPGEIRIVQTEKVTTPGLRRVGGGAVTREEEIVSRAFVVEPGTFAKLQAEENAQAHAKERAAKAAATPHYIDAASLLPQLDRVPESFLAFGLSDDEVRDQFAKSPQLLATRGREAVRGREAILGWLKGHSVEVDSRGVVKARTMDRATAEVVRTFAPILPEGVRCALPNHRGQPPLAWTVVLPSTAACQACLDETDR